MMKHTRRGDLIHVSIENMDFSYRIPLDTLGKTIKWKIGKYGTEGIVMKNVSKWALQLFTKQTLDEKYLIEFKSIVQKHAPKNSIDWKETLLAVAVQIEYNSLTALDKESEDDEIIARLEEKYKIA